MERDEIHNTEEAPDWDESMFATDSDHIEAPEPVGTQSEAEHIDARASTAANLVIDEVHSSELDLDPDEVADREVFSIPVTLPDEKAIELNKLEFWPHHPCFKSRSKDVSMAGLLASAADPQNLPPIEVLQKSDGTYDVKDGRWRLLALRAQHGSVSNVMVRCVIFSGTEAEAVEEVCDDALGSTPRTPIETAHAVFNVQRVAGITQKAISERYPALKKDQVSRMVIAARIVEQYPIIFDLLKEPDRVPIDMCVKLARIMKSSSDEDRMNILEAAKFHASEDATLKRSELLDALGIEPEANDESPAKPGPLTPISSEDIFGADDQPVGAIEMLSDEVMRIRLPDPTTMTPDEREVAAAAFIKQIKRHFELDAEG